MFFLSMLTADAHFIPPVSIVQGFAFLITKGSCGCRLFYSINFDYRWNQVWLLLDWKE